MKRLIVRTLEMFSVVAIILILVIGLGVGYARGNTEGAIVGLIIAFLLSVMTFGALFILLEMNQSLREIRDLLQKGNSLPTSSDSAATVSAPVPPSP